jgi:hypothetical protein
VGYYIRVFAKSDATVPATALQRGFDGLGWDAVIECDPGKEDRWKAILVAHGNGDHIGFVERDDVSPGSLGRGEVDEFTATLADYRPRSGAEWAREFLAQARVVFAVQVAISTEGDPDGWDVLQWVTHTLSDELDGIIHAELEGFYIKDGYLVAAAPDFERLAPDSGLVVAVRRDNGWTAFEALPDDGTFAAFQRGEVPDGVESWSVT